MQKWPRRILWATTRYHADQKQPHLLQYAFLDFVQQKWNEIRRPKMHFLVYLEPTKRVWWLQMCSTTRCGKLTTLPESLRWMWGTTLRWRKREVRGMKRLKKKKNERDGSDGRTPTPSKINFWLRPCLHLELASTVSARHLQQLLNSDQHYKRLVNKYT